MSDWKKNVFATATPSSAEEALKLLLEMPSACTSDDEVIENNRRRKLARKFIK